ncbi:NUDIX hydrolase [Paenibacillus sacheonensis]|uniref:NUDIX domain-containing protein n=1 Tax=Paenibacillus sacheonensis TaxID=742054 RepID=A0A7X4YLC0_9BACL|nr:NUDIX domain-containing protein [Paenibacillus sacheonensis]MBM7564131.1 8-oxo-dGTP diphosphatase [Paenibacillus sacheonensis]NBC67539.1 NUDIX domain-containing protein [Paenibacillus sacheonensis]
MELLHRITDQDIMGGDPALLPVVNRYASRGILLDEQANVAMMYVSRSAIYKLPGGGLENKETPDAAFMREIREETGYDADILHSLGYIEEHKKRNHYLQLSYCFIARANQAYETNLTEHEKKLGLTTRWMSLELALGAMNERIASCTDYSTSFMLLRDKLILDAAAAWLLASSEFASSVGDNESK